MFPEKVGEGSKSDGSVTTKYFRERWGLEPCPEMVVSGEYQ